MEARDTAAKLGKQQPIITAIIIVVSLAQRPFILMIACRPLINTLTTVVLAPSMLAFYAAAFVKDGCTNPSLFTMGWNRTVGIFLKA